MTARTADSTGKEIGAAKGTAILGHPLNAVIWLAADLKKDSITLQPSDLLSLGAFGMGPAEAGKTVRVTYEGLPVNPQVGVRPGQLAGGGSAELPQAPRWRPGVVDQDRVVRAEGQRLPRDRSSALPRPGP
jgi:hypothetical protein